MSEQEVTAILGQPLQIRPWGAGAVIHDYAIEGLAVSSPSLWISFENGRVRTVHAKLHHVLGEDQAIYELRGERAKFERPEFESTFTQPQ
jgi:hypothetical protein